MKKKTIQDLQQHLKLQRIKVAQQKQLKGGDGDFIIDEDGGFIVEEDGNFIIDEAGDW